MQQMVCPNLNILHEWLFKPFNVQISKLLLRASQKSLNTFSGFLHATKISIVLLPQADVFQKMDIIWFPYIHIFRKVSMIWNMFSSIMIFSARY